MACKHYPWSVSSGIEKDRGESKRESRRTGEKRNGKRAGIENARGESKRELTGIEKARGESKPVIEEGQGRNVAGKRGGPGEKRILM